MKNKKLYYLLMPLVVVMSSCTIDNVISSDDNSNNPASNIVINDGKPLTLLVDLNGLMPTTNTEPTEQQPTVFRSIQDIADEFCKMFPNVTIQWAYSKKSFGDWAM